MKGLAASWTLSLTLHAGLLGVIAVFSGAGWVDRNSVEVGIRVVQEAGEPEMRVLPPPPEVRMEFERLEPRAELEHPVAPEKDFEPAREAPAEEAASEPVHRQEPPAPLLDRPARLHDLKFSPAPTAVETAPSEIANPPPEYPPLARRRGYEGSLLLEFEVRTDGSCGEVRLLEGSGHDVLDEAAIRAVRCWRFHPATRNGHPVATRQRLRVTFKLKDGP